MKPIRQSDLPPRIHSRPGEAGFVAAFGCLLALTLLKFGNPVILSHLVDTPRGFLEWVLMGWPIGLGYGVLGLVTVLSFRVIRWRPVRPAWVLWLPVAWIAWQCLSAIGSVDPRLSQATLIHLASNVVCLYLGYLALSTTDRLGWFWIPITIALFWVCLVGFDQHYGGLEATRKYVYSQPGWQSLSPEYLKKIASDRIFSTLFYPNALAGVILLLLPGALVTLWDRTSRLPRVVRGTILGLLAYVGIACLVWSGSKAGWLIGFVMVAVLLTRLPVGRKARISIVVIVCLLALGGFTWRFYRYMTSGAPSAAARIDYWTVSVNVIRNYPIFGSGPGTFGILYRQMMKPGAEVTRLAHNDYLEQASDSGIVAGILYLVINVGSLVALYRKSTRDTLLFAVWIGLLGWVLQGVVEFGLYIPALSWMAFTLIGWLWGRCQAGGEDDRVRLVRGQPPQGRQVGPNVRERA